MPVVRNATRALGRLGPVAGAPLLASAMAAAAPLWVVSAATRRLARFPVLEPSVSTVPLVEFAPRLGIRPRPNLATVAKAQDVFRVTTDDHGRRGLLPVEAADVVAFGDSFAFGYGVDDEDCFTEHCGDLRVKAVASPAYSMVHSLLEMEQLAPRLRGKTVVWLVYCGNDLSDNLHPNLGATRVPFLRRRDDGEWETATDHVSPEPWTFASKPRDNDRLFAEMCRPGSFQARVFSAADHLIGRASDICSQASARLVVLSIPPTSMVKRPDVLLAGVEHATDLDLKAADEHLHTACTSRRVAFVPLARTLRPRHYWPDDMHWNPSGHRHVGATLAQLLDTA